MKGFKDIPENHAVCEKLKMSGTTMNCDNFMKNIYCVNRPKSEGCSCIFSDIPQPICFDPKCITGGYATTRMMETLPCGAYVDCKQLIYLNDIDDSKVDDVALIQHCNYTIATTDKEDFTTDEVEQPPGMEDITNVSSEVVDELPTSPEETTKFEAEEVKKKLEEEKVVVEEKVGIVRAPTWVIILIIFIIAVIIIGGYVSYKVIKKRRGGYFISA
jgi:hypothetical protein